MNSAEYTNIRYAWIGTRSGAVLPALDPGFVWVRTEDKDAIMVGLTKGCKFKGSSQLNSPCLIGDWQDPKDERIVIEVLIKVFQKIIFPGPAINNNYGTYLDGDDNTLLLGLRPNGYGYEPTDAEVQAHLVLVSYDGPNDWECVD